MKIRLDGLSYYVGHKALLDGVTLDVPTGATLGLVGPNGSGKSTLLRCLTGLRKPSSGRVLYDDADIATWKTRDRALRLAFVEQMTHTDSELRVRDVIGLGRLIHRPRWEPETQEDNEIIDNAVALFELAEFRNRYWQGLSGGERQRVHLARAWVQKTASLALDEPTNHLDIRHQLELLNLLHRSDKTVVIALHDLNLAVRFCDLIAVLDRGRLAAMGPPETTLTSGLMRRIFGVSAHVIELPSGRAMDLMNVSDEGNNA